MTIALRKLAMLKKSLEKKEESAMLAGYTTSPVDKELKKKIEDLMKKVRC